jgi:hypothetical protein
MSLLTSYVNLEAHIANLFMNIQGIWAYRQLANSDFDSLDIRISIAAISWTLWTPIPRWTDQKYLPRLVGRIHPLTKRDGKLVPIDEKKLDSWKTNLMNGCTSLETDGSFELVARYITYHQNRSPFIFRTTLVEVLSQLPMDICTPRTPLYFHTECADLPGFATIGPWSSFHIGITSIYKKSISCEKS